MRTLIAGGAALTMILAFVVLSLWPDVGPLPTPRQFKGAPRATLVCPQPVPPSAVADFCRADAVIDGITVDSHLRTIGAGLFSSDHPEFTIDVRRSIGLHGPAPSGQVRVVVLGPNRVMPDGEEILLANPLPVLAVGTRYVLPVSWDAGLRAFMPTWLVPGGVCGIVADRIVPADGNCDFAGVGGNPGRLLAAVERTCRARGTTPPSRLQQPDEPYGRGPTRR
jgi:hypothetical protein